MCKIKKNIAKAVLGVTLITSNAYAGIPTVDVGAIAQSVTNVIQTLKQGLESYDQMVKSYQLQAQQFVQQGQSQMNDILSDVHKAQQWLAEQRHELESALQKEIQEIIDPVTGAVLNSRNIAAVSEVLVSSMDLYNAYTNSLLNTENAYENVKNEINGAVKDTKRELTIKKFEQAFGPFSEEQYISDCFFRGKELKSCALKWGNRIAFTEGVVRTERNIQNIEKVAKHGLHVAAEERDLHVKVVQGVENGKDGHKASTKSETLTGTTSKQQLEANNIIANAELAMQRQGIALEQIEREFQKRDEQYRRYEDIEQQQIRIAERMEDAVKNREDNSSFVDTLEKHLDQEPK